MYGILGGSDWTERGVVVGGSRTDAGRRGVSACLLDNVDVTHGSVFYIYCLDISRVPSGCGDLPAGTGNPSSGKRLLRGLTANLGSNCRRVDCIDYRVEEWSLVGLLETQRPHHDHLRRPNNQWAEKIVGVNFEDLLTVGTLWDERHQQILGKVCHGIQGRYHYIKGDPWYGKRPMV